MRIGLVLDASFDNPDGVQQYVYEVGRWLTAQGYGVYYIVGETKRQDVQGIYSLSRNMRVKFNGNWLSMPLPASRRKLRKVLKELQLDVLHVQTPYSPFMAGRLIKLAPPTTAVIGTFHILPFSWLADVGSIGLKLLNARSARRFDAMMAVSEPAKQFAKKRYGFEPVVVPNMFDDARFANVSSRKTEKRNIVFLGRLVKRKGALYLLEAIAQLHHSGRLPENWNIIIGGKGPLHAELEAYVHMHGLAHLVHFAGFVDEAEKADFLAQADLAVFPSTGGESFGISLLEAMAAAHGVVIAGDNPGYRSVMNGFEQQICQPRDTDSFANLLEHWMTDVNARTITALRQKVYVKRFDADVVGRNILAMYEKALQSRYSS